MQDVWEDEETTGIRETGEDKLEKKEEGHYVPGGGSLHMVANRSVVMTWEDMLRRLFKLVEILFSGTVGKER